MLLDQYDIQQEKALKEIQNSIQEIQLRLEKEVAAKQRTIERQEIEISRLRADLDSKASIIVDLNTKYTECQSNSEGNRQLVNKLLNDLERAHQDIDWYKRTYETRSLLGTIIEKLKRL
jgi:predicted nuclease with TOPRIM domain